MLALKSVGRIERQSETIGPPRLGEKREGGPMRVFEVRYQQTLSLSIDQTDAGVCPGSVGTEV